MLAAHAETLATPIVLARDHHGVRLCPAAARPDDLGRGLAEKRCLVTGTADEAAPTRAERHPEALATAAAAHRRKLGLGARRQEHVTDVPRGAAEGATCLDEDGHEEMLAPPPGSLCDIPVTLPQPQADAATFLQTASGNENENRVPLPTVLSTTISPPIASTWCLTIERPSPVPPTSRARPRSTR